MLVSGWNIGTCGPNGMISAFLSHSLSLSQTVVHADAGLSFYILYLTVWGVEPVVTHQTAWLESLLQCRFDKGSGRPGGELFDGNSFRAYGSALCCGWGGRLH